MPDVILRWNMFQLVARLAVCALAGTGFLVHPARADVCSQERSFSTKSPFDSYSRSKKLLDRASLEIVLKFEYGEEATPVAGSRLAGKPGVAEVRGFSRAIEKVTRTLEIGLVALPGGGWEFIVEGHVDEAGTVCRNPDLDAIEPRLRALIEEVRSAAGDAQGATRKRASTVVSLSYIQTDRVLAILKALGYPIVEFSKEDGETNYDKRFTPIPKGDGPLPTVVKLIDSAKTSLMDPFIAGPPGTVGFPAPSADAKNNLGGTYLHQVTSGEELQRLLIIYEEDDPEPMFELLNLIREQIDRPARQIVMEALVIELNSDKARNLGLSFSGGKGHVEGGAFTPAVDNSGNETGLLNPFSFLTFDKSLVQSISNFKLTINALIENGDAEILSKPSVLVLDGRQAKIQVGQQVPVVNSTTQLGAVTSSVEYITIGIVLNLRPRINEDGSEVTMQVETIVSAVNQAATNATADTGLFIAPTIDNRQVQTFVRVSDDTPFIIGGLVLESNQHSQSRIPFLSDIPFIGRLFGQTSRSETKREVIIVITPHVIPANQRDLTYVIPKDAAKFDSFGNQLFQNAYRVRSSDVLDFDWVDESKILRDLVAKIREESNSRPGLRVTEPFASLLAGAVPAEDLLVRRMIWDIVKKTNYQRFVNLDRVVFFEEKEVDGELTTDMRFLHDSLANRKGEFNTFDLTFDARPTSSLKRPFARETGTPSFEATTREAFFGRLREENKPLKDGSASQWTVMLPVAPDGHPDEVLEGLRAAFVMRRILELNPTLPLQIKAFHPGRRLVFPTEEDLQNRYHVIDKEIARMYYQAMDYYPVFSAAFSREVQRVLKQLETSSP